MDVKNKDRIGYKKTKVGWIPEEWKAVKLGEYLTRKPEYGINAPAVEFSEKLPTYLRITDISDDGQFIAQNKVSVKAPDALDYSMQEDDMVFARTGASTGKTYLYDPNDGDLVFAGFLIKVKPDSSKLIPSYLKAYTETFAYWKWINIVSTRSGQPGVNGQEYALLPLPLPSLPEQEAIAGGLECWDKAIRNYEKKIEKKRNVKKGLMQRLLTGKQRLLGFSGKWEDVQLRDVLVQKPKYGINAAAVPYAEDLPTYLRITDISEYGRFLSDGAVSVNNTRFEEYYLNSGDLVFARTGASTGKTYLYNPNDGRLVFAGFLIKVTPDPSRLLPQFLKFYTETDAYWKWVSVMCLRSGQPGINGNEYARLDLRLPSVPEQKAIANVLSMTDSEIEAMERKLAILKNQKKFLLNNLVTGIIRLPQFRGGAENTSANGDKHES